MNGDIVDESDDKQLKKRKVNNNIDYSNQTQNKKSLMKYTNTETYAKAIANPDFVQLVPKIFQQNLSKQIKNEQSNSLVFNIVRKSLNSEVNKRFYYPTNTNNLENVESKNSNKIGVKQSVPQIIEKFNTPSVKEYEKKKNDVAVLKPEVTSKLSKHENKINQNIKIDNICVDKEISRDSNIVSFADFYEVSDKEGIIFHLHHPCKFSFYGALKFTLITGEIEILGFTLRKSSSTKSIITYSPEINIPMVVETKSVMQEQPKKEIRKSLKGILSQDSTNQLLNYFNANDAILLVEQVFSTFSPIAEKYMSLQIFPNNLENLSLESDALKKLQSTFKFGSNARKQFMKNEEWEQIPLNQCTILCGGKGVGKSTLLRFYVNQAISQDEKILVLDFDPGQPEFTPPGYLSAVIADKPLLGPNFTHVTEGLM